jgi:prepilin-type N-terminal cleavage/methylation domain-containing protein
MAVIRQQIARRRRGVTLLELLIVITLIGIFASTVAMRFGRSLFSEFGSQGVARELSLALLSCQRAAITNGNDHYVEFLSSGGRIAQYRVMRDVSGTPTLIDGPKTFSTDVTVAVSSTTMRYTFDGSASTSYWITITGQSRVWRIDVIAISGAISVTQTS